MARESSHAGGVKPSREAELQALLARVEAATGADRELDYQLYYRVRRGTPHHADKIDHIYRPNSFDEAVALKGGGASAGYKPPAYTASLDAALALVERVLPGWAWMTGCAPDDGFFATLQQTIDDEFACGGSADSFAKTAPLALLAALLKALIAEAATPESGATGVWTNQSPTPLSKTEVQS